MTWRSPQQPVDFSGIRGCFGMFENDFHRFHYFPPSENRPVCPRFYSKGWALRTPIRADDTAQGASDSDGVVDVAVCAQVSSPWRDVDVE
ncbi:Uncharacterised protein [Nocardia otitidiscaviarum]|uniref:Uncharacterized protein n=1 Tax=Nocardia otitidiscaviarum TaxID=1823 RepID=A0A378YK55_9NOCA|nr:Uncharacterised protein [Nocardia otitidiscaviarum]